MYSAWLMVFWLFSVEVTNSPVNAQLMQSPKGSFVSVLFPTAWSTDRHWPQLPYADRSLNYLDLLDACRNAHGLQGENKKKKTRRRRTLKLNIQLSKVRGGQKHALGVRLECELRVFWCKWRKQSQAITRTVLSRVKGGGGVVGFSSFIIAALLFDWSPRSESLSNPRHTLGMKLRRDHVYILVLYAQHTRLVFRMYCPKTNTV